jgi:DNA-binding NarL/FixJ family response regulator
MSTPTKVSIVEDNDRIRTSLAALIDGSPGYRCVSTHGNAEEACRQIPAANPDVVLLDINLPGMSGIECVHKLRTMLPAARIVMHTVYEDEDRLFKSLRAGAHGYLLKRTPPSDLLKAITDARQGCAALSGQMARMVVEYFHQQGNSQVVSLTDREIEVLDRLAEGYQNKEIAEALGISADTVRTHLHNIYEKLHVSSRTEAVIKYLAKA